MREAVDAATKGDYERAAEKIAAAEQIEPRLRRAARTAPKTIDELMPLLRHTWAAGPVLRQFRQSLGLTLMQAAEICEVSHQYLAMVEGGRKPLSKPAAEKLFGYMDGRGAKSIEESPPPAALLKLRQLLGFSQLTLAAKLGLTEVQVRRVETGNSPVSMPVADAYRSLAKEHGYDLDQLAA